MRRNKEASKAKRTTIKEKQHSTPKAVTFLKKNELPSRTTVYYSIQRHAIWAREEESDKELPMQNERERESSNKELPMQNETGRKRVTKSYKPTMCGRWSLNTAYVREDARPNSRQNCREATPSHQCPSCYWGNEDVWVCMSVCTLLCMRGEEKGRERGGEERERGRRGGRGMKRGGRRKGEEGGW